MKTTTTILLALLAGCGDTTPTNSPDLSLRADLSPTPDMSGFPPLPSIGAQIDRMGRPGINTALTDPFWDNGTRTIDQHHMTQDAYNQMSSPMVWFTGMIGGMPIPAIFGTNLAVYDGLDNTCGNQVAFNGPVGPAYATLAVVLTDDELFIDSSQTACTQYLAAELKSLGVMITDCGGRTLTYNTIDITYNALALGMTTGPVTNGVTSDGDGAPSNTTFPFLGNPN